MRRETTRRALDFASILFVVFVVVPSGAHLLELHNKLRLSVDEYMIAQRSYDGWWMIGCVIPVALALLAGQIVMRVRRRAPIGSTLVSLLCLVAAHLIFWTFTFPANQATANWTLKPADFAQVRDQWEWSHGAGALLNLTGLAALLFAVLLEPPKREGPAARATGPCQVVSLQERRFASKRYMSK